MSTPCLNRFPRRDLFLGVEYLRLLGWDGLHFEHGVEKVLDNLGLTLLASGVNLLDLGVGFLVSLVFCLLVALGVLQ